MSDCTSIATLLTPYVDGELSVADRNACDEHLRACEACRARVAVEESVHRLLSSRRDSFTSERAPQELRTRCASLAAVAPDRRAMRPPTAGVGWRARLAPLAVAASLVAIVGLAFLYQVTSHSSRVLAAELAADHVKCFALNGLLGTRQSATGVEGAMASHFGWHLRLPEHPEQLGLEVLGSRPCLYGEGRTAHVMFRHHGEPLSLFMLPNRRRAEEAIEAFGHEAVVWSVGDRTFVLVSRKSGADVERLASFIRSSIR
jgi:anti-sigma factor RsiW